MTEHSDTRAQAGLQVLLNDAAEDFFPGTAPYSAIVGEARRRFRVRAIGGSVLSVVALGAAVAVGVGGVGGSASGHGASPRTVAAGAGGAEAPAGQADLAGQAANPAGAANPAAAVNEDHYGKTVIGQGDLDGTHWTLTRDLNLQPNAAIPPPTAGQGAKSAKGSWAFDDVYVTAPNGLRDRAAGGGSTAPGQLAGLLKHFDGPNSDVAASISVTALGVGAMDDSMNKEKPSPYGIDVLSGIVSSRVARVRVVFDDGASQDAVLFAAPAGEDGQYYCLPFKGAANGYNGHVVFYDSQGHVLNSRFTQF